MNQDICTTLLSGLSVLEDTYKKHAFDCRALPADQRTRAADTPEHWESRLLEIKPARDYVLAARKGEAA